MSVHLAYVQGLVGQLCAVIVEIEVFYHVSRKDGKKLSSLLLFGGGVDTWRATVVTGAVGNSVWVIGFHAEVPALRAAVLALASSAPIVAAAHAAWAVRRNNSDKQLQVAAVAVSCQMRACCSISLSSIQSTMLHHK